MEWNLIERINEVRKPRVYAQKPQLKMMFINCVSEKEKVVTTVSTRSIYTRIRRECKRNGGKSGKGKGRG